MLLVEDSTELLVGSHKAAAAFGYKFGGTARKSGKAVDVAFVTLHQAQDFFKFGHGLTVGKIFGGSEYRLFSSDIRVYVKTW